MSEVLRCPVCDTPLVRRDVLEPAPEEEPPLPATDRRAWAEAEDEALLREARGASHG